MLKSGHIFSDEKVPHRSEAVMSDDSSHLRNRHRMKSPEMTDTSIFKNPAETQLLFLPQSDSDETKPLIFALPHLVLRASTVKQG